MFDRATRCHLVDKHTSVALTCRLPCREQMNLFAICLQAQVDVLAAGFALCSSCLSLSLICADSGLNVQFVCAIWSHAPNSPGLVHQLEVILFQSIEGLAHKCEQSKNSFTLRRALVEVVRLCQLSKKLAVQRLGRHVTSVRGQA